MQDVCIEPKIFPLAPGEKAYIRYHETIDWRNTPQLKQWDYSYLPETYQLYLESDEAGDLGVGLTYWDKEDLGLNFTPNNGRWTRSGRKCSASGAD